MRKVVIYIHGQGGNPGEAEHYKPLFKGYDVIGFDYRSDTPWEAADEFNKYFDSVAAEFDSVSIIANSIGAYFALCGLNRKNIEKAWFISPVVNMEKLITNMMAWADITEEKLRIEKKITTPSGDVLSWEYLCYAREKHTEWKIPTSILYGEKDNLTSLKDITAFADSSGADLKIMPGGEHWFHTEEQMKFLDNWIADGISKL